MKSTAVLVLAALATMAAAPQPTQQGRQTPGTVRTRNAAASSQPTQHSKQTPDAAQTLIAPYVQPGSENPPTPDRPYLFKLGSLPVRLWAPVPQPYDSNANRTIASNRTLAFNPVQW